MTDYSLANLSQPAGPRRRTGLVIGLIAGGVLLVIAAVAVTLFLTMKSGPAASPTGAATPMANGIARPDATCVQTNGKDHQDMWNANGWWAGRIDGTEKQMSAFAALSQTLGGHEVDSAWICAPR